jgi:hypothetical protein
MTALWLAPVEPADQRPDRPGGRGPALCVVARGAEGPAPAVAEWFGGRDEVAARPLVFDDRPESRRRVSPAVRRRRTLLGLMALLLVGLALPLSGTGGHSHTTGSALAETGGPVGYTARPGDTLWTIAERVDPHVDPRPLVARLAAQTGSDRVVPGERIVLP